MKKENTSDEIIKDANHALNWWHKKGGSGGALVGGILGLGAGHVNFEQMVGLDDVSPLAVIAFGVFAGFFIGRTVGPEIGDIRYDFIIEPVEDRRFND
ncbi:MAG: hypothetical protein ACJKTH_02295 [Patescibacteria group bacterium UBA2163]